MAVFCRSRIIPSGSNTLVLAGNSKGAPRFRNFTAVNACLEIEFVGPATDICRWVESHRIRHRKFLIPHVWSIDPISAPLNGPMQPKSRDHGQILWQFVVGRPAPDVQPFEPEDIVAVVRWNIAQSSRSIYGSAVAGAIKLM